MEQADIQLGTYNLAQVLAAEAEEIAAQCKLRGAEPDLHFEADQPPSAVPDRLGVAFSGGGIRSACVGLGILQGLAGAKLLRQVHYFSGISGGGYALGYLSAWIYRQDSCDEKGNPKPPDKRSSLQQVEDQLGCNTATGKPESPGKPPAYMRHLEPFPLHYLRRYSSYLTPRSGLFSGDTLAMASIYLRNVLLNLSMLTCMAIAGLLLLQLPAFLNSAKGFSDVFIGECTFWPLIFLFTAAFFIGIFFTAQSLQRLSMEDKREWYYAADVVILCGVVACAAIWLLLPRWYLEISGDNIAFCAITGLSATGIILTLIYNRNSSNTSVEQSLVVRGVIYTLSWLITGFAGFLVHVGLHHWITTGRILTVPHSYAIFGLPAVLLALSLNSYLWVGVMGNSFPDAKREWLARAAGYFLGIAIVIGLSFGSAFYGPVCMHLVFTSFRIPGWKKYLLSVVLPGGWLFTVLTGLLGAQSSKSSGDGSENSKWNTVITVAPPVFLLGVLLVTSWASHALVEATVLHPEPGRTPAMEYLPWAEWSPSPSAPVRLQWHAPGPQTASLVKDSVEPHPIVLFSDSTPTGKYLLIWITFLVIAFGLACRLDVNEFSLHLFYRNRLVRAFLGASRPEGKVANGQDPRHPSFFTGFAAQDDIFLRDLTAAKGFQGPYPIWGTCLNMTTGEDLAWQQRKGASFIYSPLFCGWDFVNRFNPPIASEEPLCDLDKDRKHRTKDELSGFGYRSTRPKNANHDNADHIPGYGGDGGAPLIGTAMAASGAAVSPNSGYHSQPGVAALLTLFNLRLGWWTGNPRRPDTWKEYAPPIGYLLAELIGKATDRGRYVYLSDGGHFENLGIYELVRRRVRFIICSDADADPNFSFGDLGNAIDHCRRDFGVEINIGAQRSIAAAKQEGFRDAHFAVGEIIYPGQSQTGVLLYIKSSLTSDEPCDVLGMKAQDKNFPHDTTINQFFSESMFESYRALGQHMMEWLIDKSGALELAPNQNESLGSARTRRLFKWAKAQSNRIENIIDHWNYGD